MTVSYFDIGCKFDRAYRHASKTNFELHEPIYMYHVSNQPLHEFPALKTNKKGHILLKPKCPSSSECDIGHIPRICVAPSIEQCMNAIAHYPEENYYYVYRTTRKVSKSVVPYGVVDAPLTQERWLVHPRTFIHVASIPANYNFIFKSEEFRNKHDYHLYKRTPIGGCSIFPDFRGGRNTFHMQHKELTRTRKFFKDNEVNFFMNKLEYNKHKKQRSIKLRLNRYDTTELYSSSFD